jgi:hypothetical protein
MSEPTRGITRFASNLHVELKDLSDAFGTLLVDTFQQVPIEWVSNRREIR